MDPNRYGTPPASKSAVEALPNIKIDEKILKSDNSQCAVCMDTFIVDDVVKEMPCKHMYHERCIMPWLEPHNSCPVCRFELPTDDGEYEARASRGREEREVGTTSRGGGERRFRITLPWPFRGSGGGEGSGGGGSSGGQPTDDGEYEARASRGMEEREVGTMPRGGGERRFRITLPWPFRGSGGGEGSGGGGSSGGQPTDEDLD